MYVVPIRNSLQYFLENWTRLKKCFPSTHREKINYLPTDNYYTFNTAFL